MDVSYMVIVAMSMLFYGVSRRTVCLSAHLTVVWRRDVEITSRAEREDS